MFERRPYRDLGMRRTDSRLALLGALALTASCGGDDGGASVTGDAGPDASSIVDAGSSVDASVDAGADDASPHSDADAAIARDGGLAAVVPTFVSADGPFGAVYYWLGGSRGLVLCFHGSGGSAAGWSRSGDENNEFVFALAEAGFSFVCPTSLDRVSRQWSAVNDASNADVQNVDALLDDLEVDLNVPLFVVGHSQGGSMVSRYAILSARRDAVRAAQYSNTGGVAQILGSSSWTVPSLFFYAECDRVVPAASIQRSLDALMTRTDAPPFESVVIDALYAGEESEGCHAFKDTSTDALRFFASHE